MDAQSTLTAAISLAVGFSFLCVLYALWRSYQLDVFRDKMFALRDELFLFADDARLSGSPAHLLLRAEINGMIRYAHRISALRIVILLAGRKIFGLNPILSARAEAVDKAIGSLAPRCEKAFTDFRDHAMVLMLQHMVASSIVLRAAVGLLVLTYRGRRPSKSIFRSYANSEPMRLMEADALCEAY